jgi:hypothetical protein
VEVQQAQPEKKLRVDVPAVFEFFNKITFAFRKDMAIL